MSFPQLLGDEANFLPMNWLRVLCSTSAEPSHLMEPDGLLAEGL